jgi:ribonuclease HI
MKVVVYTDGACKGNPGPGGYGAYLQYSNGDEMKLSEGYYKTTNNRMELLGFLSALEYLKLSRFRGDIEVYTDSKYISGAVNNGWLNSWQQKGFFKRPNSDLWARIDELIRQFGSRLSLNWVKGHASIEGNVVADNLAVEASLHPKQVDAGYDDTIQENTVN